MLDTDSKVDKLTTKLKNIAKESINNKNFERALASISAAAQIFYDYNQKYVDEELEDMLIEIADKAINIEYKKKNHDDCDNANKTVLFYDAFGLDIRGLALQYVRAIVKGGFKLIYVTNKRAKHKQPALEREFEKYGVTCRYIDMRTSYMRWMKELIAVFEEYCPSVSFLYDTPHDSAGVAVFDALAGFTTRYQIDLTGHAFWLGAKACDYYLEGSERTASYCFYKRKIPKEKLVLQNVCAQLDNRVEFLGLPEGIQNRRFIFSGGSLYKTLADGNHYFYKIVEHILTKFDDLCFLYVGEGDRSELNLLIEKYPTRVFYQHERLDFYEIMKRCTLYLNTYPMFGGMMMRYAVLAHKIPITLRHEHDADGVLLNQEATGCMYNTYEALISDVDKLLQDKDYLTQREEQAQVGILREEQFEEQIKALILGQRRCFDFPLKDYDTSKFIAEFKRRFSYNKSVASSIARPINFSLFSRFPSSFFKRLFYVDWRKKLHI